MSDLAARVIGLNFIPLLVTLPGTLPVTLLVMLLGALLGALLAVAFYWVRVRMTVGSLGARATQIIQDAQVDRERILRAAEVEAKDALLRMQQEHELEVEKHREDMTATERRVRQRETNVERKNELVERRERELKKREAAIQSGEQRCAQMAEEVEKRVAEAQREFERVAGLSQAQAREEIVASLQERARREAASKIRRIEEEAQKEADARGRNIVVTAIQRLAGEYVAEKTVSVVELPSDDMKGRIIGREGRNIRAIEAATGVDVIIDDTPEVVVVSAFNPVRREIAKIALLHLVSDGRIHPARIEEVVERAKSEVEERIVRAGERATFDLGLHGLHPELVKLVGKLKFRSVNGQNAWDHAMETAQIAGLLAAEVGEKENVAKRAGLLHDIGKAVEHEVAGSHEEIAAEQARRYGEKAAVVDAIRFHHAAEPPTLLAILVQAADQLSKSRPGARRDMLETYVKRLENLEKIAAGYKGVKEALVVQAGREIRVVVDYTQVGDDEAFMLSKDIARHIEDELAYPGEVRVHVIRESRATQIAG